MNRRYSNRRVLLLVLIVCMLLVGGVFAYMFKKTAVTSNQFVPANIVCTVNETFADSKKTSITITNNESEGSNIDAYLRVMLVSYWVDGDGKIVSKKSEMPTVKYDGENWVKSDTDHIYYYKSPVEPGSETTNLLATDKYIELTKSEHNGETVYQVVEVFAEGIQANPTNTVESVWGVDLEGTTIKTVR